MTLTECFSRYLADPSLAEPLIDRLAASPFALEGALLARHAAQGAHVTLLGGEAGNWAGRRVHVTPELPPPTVGELWFDPCECVTQLVVPDLSEEETRSLAPSARAQIRREHGWISLRPVAKWQLGAFLRLAKTATPLDAPGALAGDEHEPVLRASITLAAGYAMWFGKGSANDSDWEAALRLLGEEGIPALWSHGGREWAGGIAQADAFVALDRDAIGMDYRDELDREESEPPPPGERRFFGPHEAPGDVAFRTAVSVRDGLRAAPVALPGVDLQELVGRARWRH